MLKEYRLNSRTKFSLLDESIHGVSANTIESFANEDLPNEFFIQQFLQPGIKPFCEKKYWRSFARILICRGVNKLSDVKEELLMWLQDINNPGSVEICRFVGDNFIEFEAAIKTDILKALDKGDDAWFNTLLVVLLQNKGLPEIEISSVLRGATQAFENKNKTTFEELLNNFV